MKNSTLFIFLIFFCISEKPLQASDCGLARFDILQKLKPLATSVEIYDFKIQKEEVQSKINDIEEQLKLIPVNLSVSTSNSQNFEGLEKNKQISEQKNSIDLSYNLNRIKLNNTNEQLKIRKLLLELQLDELKAREAVNVYKGLLEYIMSMELNSYFQTEKRFYQIKKDYFNERKEFGDLNLDNLLKVEKEIRNISDKILANSVKQIESLNQLNISEEFIPKQLALSTSRINVLADNCRFKPLFLERYSIEKNYQNKN